MEGNRRTILLSEGVIFISPTDFFPLTQTTFPEDSLKIKIIPMHTLWEVECTLEGDTITMEVVDYDAKSTKDFYHGQGFKDPSLKQKYRLAFKNLDWQQLERRLSSYRLSELRPFMNPETLKSAVEKAPSVPDFTLPHRGHKSDPYVYDPPEVIHGYDIEVFYKDAKFCDGFVTFTRAVTCHFNPIQFKIVNPAVLSEFDTVKEYFSKAINNRKKFAVKVNVKVKGHILIDYSATSHDIDKINSSLIEGMAKERIRKLTSPRSNKSGKSIFTADELLLTAPSDLDTVFKHTGQNILNSLIEIKDVRNRLQLEYLARDKQSTKEKLRFTLNPNFGFLFFIEGGNNNHFCWELLDSHATYIWTLNNSIKNQFPRIDNVIKMIQTVGRQQYKVSHNNGEVDTDLKFNAIYHNDANSSAAYGFENWKFEVDAVFAS